MMKLSEIIEKIDERSLRERILILLSILVLVYYVWQTLVFDNLFGVDGQISESALKIRRQISKIQGQITDISEALRVNPLEKLAKDKEKLEGINLKLQENIEKLTEQLIPPGEMAKLVGKILAQDEGLTLVHMENLSEKALFSKKQIQDEETIKRFQVYQHGLALEFVGSYFETSKFLASLESLPWKILWEDLTYEVFDYPLARVKILVYTLSLQQKWIGI